MSGDLARKGEADDLTFQGTARVAKTRNSSRNGAVGEDSEGWFRQAWDDNVIRMIQGDLVGSDVVPRARACLRAAGGPCAARSAQSGGGVGS